VARIVDAVKSYLEQNQTYGQPIDYVAPDRKTIRLTENRLEVMGKLDADEPTSRSELAKIQEIFLEFRLQA